MVAEWQCGEQTPRMKGPCILWKEHVRSLNESAHRSRSPENEDTPRLRRFTEIVHASLDQGLQLTYVEIAEIMGHPNPRSVASYGMGARYTRLRQRIYRERGIVPDRRRLTENQRIVRELKLKGAF